MSFWGHEPLATIDADTAAREIEEGAQLVDIGEPGDWLSGHLPGALLVEPELVDAAAATDLSKVKPVVIAGRDPDVTIGSATYLHDHGFRVAILAGGPAAWKHSGRELVHPDGR
jgi:rhodanese-related sulfurtransferase